MKEAVSLIGEVDLGILLKLAGGTPPGDFAEFGVYQGGSAQHLAKLARERGSALYLFDTFSGIPFQGDHDPHAVGDFCDTSVDTVRALIPDAIVVCGTFPESAKDVTFPKPLAFVHVDADQHDSIAAACAFFPPLMVSGGVMLFDDYNILEGATLAVHEWGEPITTTPQGKAVWRKP